MCLVCLVCLPGVFFRVFMCVCVGRLVRARVVVGVGACVFECAFGTLHFSNLRVSFFRVFRYY